MQGEKGGGRGRGEIAGYWLLQRGRRKGEGGGADAELWNKGEGGEGRRRVGES